MSSFDEIQNREAGLHKKLSAKQMGMIAIGGAIGTGLFMGSKFGACKLFCVSSIFYK
ncbi:hypothetical protein KTJ02_08520 [Acinetobacter baumannii]|nr:hypothetical protein [Acinetobacter baumannii]